MSAQIIQANPNMVRIAWYNDYGQSSRPAYNLTHLDSLITRFSRKGIVSIVGLWDVTCGNDYNAFATYITPFWKSPAVLALINKHKGMMLVEIANEFGYVDWASNPTTAFTTWKNNYKTAITTLRTAGITVPLVINAPECGTNLARLLSAMPELEAADPMHHIIGDVHAYWSGDLMATAVSKVQQIAAAGFPVIIGEVANWEDDVDAQNNPIYCAYSLASIYPSILTTAQNNQVGWAAWCWNKDGCSARQVSNNGTFASLSAWGQTIVHNAAYGLAAQAQKTAYMTNGTVCLSELLPLTLLFFNAYAVAGRQALLQWETAAEINSQGFYIERSTDGAQWQHIAFINTKAATGNSHEKMDYTYTDYPAPANPVYYYRLLQTDMDGTMTYSPTRKLAFETTKVFMAVYPNPSNGQFSIEVSEAMRLHITDITGQPVAACLNTPLHKGMNTLSLQVPAGVYFLHGSNEKERFTEKLIIY
jgi:mannan endo-1,4-beta-mannosidase